jgi:hypothetical protein
MRCGFLFDAFLLGFAHFLLLFFFAKSEPRCGFYFGPSFFFGLLLFFCLTLFSLSPNRAAGFHFDAPLPLPLLTFSHTFFFYFFRQVRTALRVLFWPLLLPWLASFASHLPLSLDRAAGLTYDVPLSFLSPCLLFIQLSYSSIFFAKSKPRLAAGFQHPKYTQLSAPKIHAALSGKPAANTASPDL